MAAQMVNKAIQKKYSLKKLAKKKKKLGGGDSGILTIKSVNTFG